MYLRCLMSRGPLPRHAPGPSSWSSKWKAPEPVCGPQAPSKRGRTVVNHCLGDGTMLLSFHNGATEARRGRGTLLVLYIVREPGVCEEA